MRSRVRQIGWLLVLGVVVWGGRGLAAKYDQRALRTARAELPLDAVAATRPGAHESVPDETGAFVYEATSLRPLIEGRELSLVTHEPSGLVAARVPTIRQGGYHSRFFHKDSEGAYWTVGDIPEGDYWLGMLRSGGLPAVYLNGRVVQMTSATDDLRVAPGAAYNELRAAEPVRLRPGDEIAVMTHWGCRLARLTLRPQAPPPGRHFVAPHYGPHTGGPDTAMAVTGQALFHGINGSPLPNLQNRDGGRNQRATGAGALEKDEDGRPVVRCDIFNPFPTPVEVDYSITVRSYFRLPVGGQSGRIRLEPHTRWHQPVPFDLLPDERAYSAEIRVAVVEPRDQTAWREAMNWPDLDWIAFFPGMRQGVAWPEPFEDYDLRRLEFSNPVQAARRRVLLDDDGDVWEVAYSPDWQAAWPTEESLVWNPQSVPVRWPQTQRMARQQTPPANALYLRRTFELPADALQESCEIYFGGTSHEALLYVNDVEVGRIRGGNTPVWADITPVARPGLNTLVIVARNALAVMNPDYINPDAPEPNLNYLDAPAQFSARGMNVRTVELLIAPRVSARNLQVITQTRAQTLQARFEVVNHRPEPVRARVTARIYDGADVALDLGERELLVDSGASQAHEFATRWEDARWWWPADPHLYVMAIETVDADTGERLDLLRERFGFRESRIEGPHMILNDLPIRPNGSWLGYREKPNHFARGVAGSAGADYCDERGMMGGTYITQLSNTSSRHNIESDSFWATSEKNAVQAIRQWVNHPSIGRWDMSNEWLKYLDYHDPMYAARRFKRLSDVVRAFDPTRWTTYGSEGDVHGLMDHFDFHYMVPYFGGALMRGVFPYLPDGEFWRELDDDFVPGQGIPLNSHTPDVILRPDEKMFFDREFLWKTGALMPPGTTQFAGENVSAWSAWDAASGPILWMWKQKLDGHRDVGVAKINSYTHPGLKRRVLTHQTFIVPEVQHQLFGGRTIERRYAVLQDLYRTCDMVFRWTLRGPDGSRLDGGEDRQRMSSGTTHRGILRVALPEVAERTLVTLVLELESDGVLVMAEERDLAVWPNAPVQVGPLERQVVLFEPGVGRALRARPGARTAHTLPVSDTAEALTAAGVPFERIENLSDLSDLSDPSDPSQSLLLIAEDALDADNRRDTLGLSDFVESGGRVLILRQTVTPAGLPADTQLDAPHWASQVFIRAGNHPILEGLSDWDFHFWAADRSVVRGGYMKPHRGPATILLDSGQARGRASGLDWTGLMEMYQGNGLYLLCQLPVVDKHTEAPMARELLARMLRYLGNAQAFREPRETLAVLAEPESPIMERLQAIEAVTTSFAPDAVPGHSASVLLDAALARASVPAKAAAWAEAIEAGAVVTVSGAGPGDEAWLSELAGAPVSFSVTPYPDWDGRGLRIAWTPLTAGLSHLDQYWKRFEGHQSAGNQAERDVFILETFQSHAVTVDDPEALESVWPGALVELRRGAGRLILDQRHLYTRHTDLMQRAERVVSALVLGMGGQLTAAVEGREMPAPVAYRPIDLSSLANRALVDETPEDGEGGWTDQGSGADLREFPTHRRRLGGVPFAFPEGENKCIVLRYSVRPFAERLPTSVTIPIGMAVEGLYFLHATAWGGRPTGVYEIQFDDDEIVEIALYSRQNISDWVNPPTHLPRERGTRSVLAWTGRTRQFARVGIFRMEWVSPTPDRVVKAVRFYKPEGSGGQPVLLGLTAALPADGEYGISEEDKARAVALAAEAAEALRANQPDLARTKVQEALALDDTCEDAHAARADLAERSGDEDERIRVYQEWIDTGATRPRPYNEVGAILEQRGNLRGALDAFRRSIEVEWNQPPIIEAVSRLEQQVK